MLVAYITSDEQVQWLTNEKKIIISHRKKSNKEQIGIALTRMAENMGSYANYDGVGNKTVFVVFSNILSFVVRHRTSFAFPCHFFFSSANFPDLTEWALGGTMLFSSLHLYSLPCKKFISVHTSASPFFFTLILIAVSYVANL